MRYLLLSFLLGALIVDWAHLRSQHLVLHAERDALYHMTARYEKRGRAQDNALWSCRKMVDDFMDARRNSPLFAIAAEKH